MTSEVPANAAMSDSAVTVGRRLADAEAARADAEAARADAEAARADAEAARRRLEAVIESIPAGVCIAESPTGNLILKNSGAATLFETPKSREVPDVEAYRSFEGFRSDGSRYEPHQWPIARSLIAGEVVSGEEVTIVRGSGERATLLFHSAPIRNGEGRIVDAVVVFHDITERKLGEESLRRLAAENAQLLAAEQAARVAAERTADRLARLQGVTQALSGTRSSDEVGHVILDQALFAVGAEAGALYLPAASGEGFEVVRQTGMFANGLAETAAITAHREVPVVVAKIGEPVWLTSPEQIAARFPALASLGPLDARPAFCALPLRIEGRTLGVISMSFTAPRLFSDDERGFLLALGQQCAIALDRLRLYEAERQAAERAEFLAGATSQLAESLDYEATIGAVLGLVVPRFADGGSVDMAEGDGVLRRVGTTHAVPEKAEAARILRERFPTHRSTDPSSVVMASGRPLLFREVPEQILDWAAVNDEHRFLLRQCDIASLMIVPIRSRGATVGVIHLGRGRNSRRFDDADLAFVEEFTRRVGLAIDNARLFAEANKAIRLRDDFLSIASHELRTPLSSLSLQVQSLLRSAQSGREVSPAQKEAKLLAAWGQAQRIERLIDDLLDISRIAVGRLQLEPERFDLRELGGEVIARFEEQPGRLSPIAFAVGLPVEGHWDRGRLDQVVTNLLANALKYGDGKPIAVEITGTATTARLRVIDQGIGIASESLGRIFGRFERAVSERNFGGFGLGLWIARQIVDAHQGTIVVDSRPGMGSTFTVELPRASVESVP